VVSTALPAKQPPPRYRARVRFRNPRLPALILAVGALLSACAETTSNAVVINGTATSNSDFEDRLEIYTDRVEAFAQGFSFCQPGADGLPVPITGATKGSASVPFGRCLLNLQVQTDVIVGEAKARKLDLVGGDWEAADQQAVQFVGNPDSFAKLPKSEQDYFKNVFRAVAAIGKDGAKDFVTPATPVQECVRHILVEAEADAKAIVAEIRAGADFATIAQEKSIDPGSGAQGGSLDTPGGPCNTPEVNASAYVPEFAAAIATAKVGEVTDPVKSEFGYHLIEVTKRGELFAAGSPEAAEFAEQAADQARGEAFGTWFTTAMADVEVTVDPRYGIWNDERQAIEAQLPDTPPLAGEQVPTDEPATAEG
jgi:hypothetical protein